jgi:hypothetical protein
MIICSPTYVLAAVMSGDAQSAFVHPGYRPYLAFTSRQAVCKAKHSDRIDLLHAMHDGFVRGSQKKSRSCSSEPWKSLKSSCRVGRNLGP